MLNFSILNSKPTRVDRLGETIIDFFKGVIQFKNNLKIKKVVKITDEMVMRADLVSKLVWGSDEHEDLLLKYNGIANPFAVNSGDLMMVPELSDLKDSIIVSDRAQENVNSPLIDPAKLSKKDQKRIEILKAKGKALSGVEGNVLPPTQTGNPDFEEIVVKDGLIIFGGETIKPTKDSCTQEPLSKTEFKSKMLQLKQLKAQVNG